MTITIKQIDEDINHSNEWLNRGVKPQYKVCDRLVLYSKVLQKIASGDDWFDIDSAPHDELVLLHCPDRGCVSNSERIEYDYASQGKQNGFTSNVSTHSWATKWKHIDNAKHIEMLMQRELED